MDSIYTLCISGKKKQELSLNVEKLIYLKHDCHTVKIHKTVTNSVNKN